MKRKLVKQGAATMMISLPSKWIKEFNLDKGDEIDLEESGKDLIIRSGKSIQEKTKSIINISEFKPLGNRAIVSLYNKGVDELEINFKDPEDVKKFQNKVINELLGFEIIRQTQNTLYIKKIAESEEIDIDDLIKRIFFILDSMFEELISALEKKQSLDPIIATDSSVNKFSHFCMRRLNKKGYKDFSKTSQVYGLVYDMEKIGDAIKGIAEEYKESVKASKQDIEILKKIKNLLNMVKNLFFNFNPEDTVKISLEYKKIKGLIKGKGLIAYYLFDLNRSIVSLDNHIFVISL